MVHNSKSKGAENEDDKIDRDEVLLGRRRTKRNAAQEAQIKSWLQVSGIEASDNYDDGIDIDYDDDIGNNDVLIQMTDATATMMPRMNKLTKGEADHCKWMKNVGIITL